MARSARSAVMLESWLLLATVTYLGFFFLSEYYSSEHWVEVQVRALDTWSVLYYKWSTWVKRDLPNSTWRCPTLNQVSILDLDCTSCIGKKRDNFKLLKSFRNQPACVHRNSPFVGLNSFLTATSEELIRMQDELETAGKHMCNIVAYGPFSSAAGRYRYATTKHCSR